MLIRLSLATLLALSLNACGDDDGVADAAPDTSTEDAAVDAAEDTAPDVEEDTGPPPPSELFGECVEDSQCPGPGGVCQRPTDGWPHGFCTKSCTQRVECMDDLGFHDCAETPGYGMVCQQTCLNSPDCLREDYVCIGRTSDRLGQCRGFCTSDDDCSPARCNVWSGECMAEPPAEGGETGDPCDSDEACKSGICLMEVNGAPTGWLGGTCVANCILPVGYNSNNYYAGDAYPTEQCPGGDVCVPNGSLARGEVGLCLPVCENDGDCREGYACDKSITLQSGTYTFDNGYCLPINCDVGPSDRCPEGTSCRTVGSGDNRRNVCAR